jgi:hypothetical protein
MPMWHRDMGEYLYILDGSTYRAAGMHVLRLEALNQIVLQ